MIGIYTFIYNHIQFYALLYKYEFNHAIVDLFKFLWLYIVREAHIALCLCMIQTARTLINILFGRDY